MASSLPLGDCHEHEVDIPDARLDVERLALLRHDLRRISEKALELSEDQRLVLKNQLTHDMGCAEFCRAYGWTPEKYRKVAQRARTRLKRLLATDQLLPEPVASQPNSFVPSIALGRIREQGHL